MPTAANLASGQSTVPFDPPQGFERADPNTPTDAGDEWITVWSVDFPSWMPFETILEGWTTGQIQFGEEINDRIDGSISIIDTWGERSNGQEYLFLHYRAETSPGPPAIAAAIGEIGFAALIGLGIAIGLIAISLSVAWKLQESDPGTVAGLGVGALVLGGLVLVSMSGEDGDEGLI